MTVLLEHIVMTALLEHLNLFTKFKKLKCDPDKAGP